MIRIHSYELLLYYYYGIIICITHYGYGYFFASICIYYFMSMQAGDVMLAAQHVRRRARTRRSDGA